MATTKSPSILRYRSPVHQIFRSASQLLLMKPAVWSVLTVRVHGRKNLKSIKTSQAFIAVANHSSHFDAPLVVGALPHRLGGRLATAAAADVFFKNFRKAAPTRLFFNTFPVDRGESREHKGLAGELLDSGTPLLIFPEGTRSRTGTMGEFKPGAAALSISHRVPIMPAAIVGAHAAWPPSAKRWRSGRPPIHITFGSPLWPETNETIECFNDRLRATVAELYHTTEKEQEP